MKGFVPVTKASLLTMIEECRGALLEDFDEKEQRAADKYVKAEIARTTVRRWYRLWMLPKARFDAESLESIKNYSNNRKDYALCEGCPFMALDGDAENSIRWLNRLENIATSEHSSEPILLDTETFSRISKPYRYSWVSDYGWFYTIKD